MTRSSSPTVSVIIPVHNGERYLRETVKSVLGQTYEDVELIIVDDASTDGSPDLAKSFSGGHVRCLVQAHQGGVCKTRNLGLSLSRGKYVAFLDQDDVWLPDALEHLVHYLDHHESGAVCGQFQILVGGSQRLPLPVSFLPYAALFVVPEEPLEIMKLGYGFLLCAALFRKSLVEQIGGFEEGFTAAGGYEDTELTVRLSSVTSFGHISEVVALYRIHESNNSNARLNSRAHVHNRGVYLRKCLERYGRDPHIAVILWSQLVGFYSDLGKIQTREGFLSEGRANLCEAICLSWKKHVNPKMFARSSFRLVKSYLSS